MRLKGSVYEMNDLTKLYQLVVNHELATFKNEVLDTTRIKKKLLAFLNDVSEVGELTHVYTFWEHDQNIVHEEVLETYVEGMSILMSIGYEMRIDEVRTSQEIPETIPLEDLLFAIYQNAIILKNTYDPLVYQDLLDDYFHLGFRLGISLEEIVNSYE